MLIGDLLDKLQGVRKLRGGDFLALCPAHPDKKQSLTLKQTDDKILLKCLAGCQTEDIVASLGITMADLFVKEATPLLPATEKKIVATYDYLNEDGQFLFQVVRYDPKGFAQRHKNGAGDWVWHMKGVRRVLYHLPEILIEPDNIYFVEGEKDADLLWQWGQVATTSPGGTNNWKPEYANYLINKRVVVIPDKDTAGYDYARSVIRSLKNKAKEVKCLILPGEEVKDFSDWIEAGNNIAELPSLEQDVAVLLDPERVVYQQEDEAIIWQKNIKGQYLTFQAESMRQERTGIHARISIEFDYQPLAWSLFNVERSEDRTRLSNLAFTNLTIEDYTKEALRRDLDTFCAGLWDFHISQILPELIGGDETQEPPNFYLYPYIIEGGGSILFAAPGRGKSQTALLWAQSINCGISSLWQVSKVPVLYINLERSGQSIRRRLANVNRVLGLPTNQPLLTLNVRGKSLADVAPIIRRSIKTYGIKLIILDSISRAGYGDLTENRPANSIIDALSGLCESWLALGHTPRASEEHPYGSIMAEAGADIVIQLRSEAGENKLGLGFEITKSNDLPQFSQRVFAFEFEDWKLKDVRKATPYEFPNIEAKSKTNMLDDIINFISNQDSGDATTTDIERELGYNRVNISKLLNASGSFVKTRKEGRLQFYGVKTYD